MKKNKDINVNNYGGGSVSFFGLLALLFIGLKLTGYINWSWWWILSPIWIPSALAVSVVIIILLVLGVIKLLNL